MNNMKNLVTIIALITFFNCSAQDSTYNATVKFNLSDSVENGISFQRKCFFQEFNYDQEQMEIALKYRVEFFNTNGTKRMKSVKEYLTTYTASRSKYVLSSIGFLVGSIQKVLSLYAKYDANGEPVQFPDGRYDLTTACMTEYDYLAKSFDNNQKLNSTIKSIGQREIK